MKIGLYGVRDQKAEAFVHFFTAATDAVAIRILEDACADPQSNVARHPEDFSVNRICYVEQVDGDVTPALEQLTTGAVIRALSKE